MIYHYNLTAGFVIRALLMPSLLFQHSIGGYNLSAWHHSNLHVVKIMGNSIVNFLCDDNEENTNAWDNWFSNPKLHNHAVAMSCVAVFYVTFMCISNKYTQTHICVYFRDRWRHQNGWIFGKVPNGLWPPPLIFGKSCCGFRDKSAYVHYGGTVVYYMILFPMRCM